VTEIGDHNVFMAYAHVAHDCHVGHHTIFGNAATLGGHVTVEDYAAISAFSGVHQFCRVGRYAFVGGYSVVTKDALPFAKTVGNRARLRPEHHRSHPPRLLQRHHHRLKRAFRYLLQSKLNTSAALRPQADETLACTDVQCADFIRRSNAASSQAPRAGRRALGRACISD
jgi:UDP-N-acetylglucosamine acyltransferase